MQKENWKIRVVGHISDHQWGAVIRGGAARHKYQFNTNHLN